MFSKYTIRKHLQIILPVNILIFLIKIIIILIGFMGTISILLYSQGYVDAYHNSYYNVTPDIPLDEMRILITPSISCLQFGEQKTLIVVGVESAIKNKQQRSAIRKTWGADVKNIPRQSKIQMVLLFFIGKPKNPENLFGLTEEVKLYQDIVQYDFLDTYKNLTLKTTSIFDWTLRKCPQADYIFKTDDDVFFNVPKLIDEYNSGARHTDVVVGRGNFNTKPQRNLTDKWYISYDEYQNKTYPNYVFGSGYIISKSSLLKILTACRETQIISIEDVFYTGVCRVKAGVEVKADTEFQSSEQSGQCYLNSMIHVTPIEHSRLLEVWPGLQAVRNGSKKC